MTKSYFYVYMHVDKLVLFKINTTCNCVREFTLNNCSSFLIDSIYGETNQVGRSAKRGGRIAGCPYSTSLDLPDSVRWQHFSIPQLRLGY